MNERAVRDQYETASSLLKADKHGEAFRIYRALADSGIRDPQLFYQLGWMSRKGLGTAADAGQAERWFSGAAELGSAPGQFTMAVLLVERGDYDSARAWLEQAAAQGYTPAIYHLGRMYELGRWGPLDKAKAIRHFEEAARRGHVWAERQLAVSLLRGAQGISRIPEGAKRFIVVIVKAWRLRARDPDSEYLFV